MADTADSRRATDTALAAYAVATGRQPLVLQPNDDARDTVVDLIADLMHYADRCGFSVDGVIRTADMHFTEERAERMAADPEAF